MELQDVMSLVGQAEYWPLMIGGLLFVLMLVLYRRVGKSAGATSRDLAALHDAVEQLSDRFDRLAASGFPAVPDARPESPRDDDTAPRSATGAVAGLAAGAVMTESEEALGDPL
jgi:hypothetical protein